MMQQTEDHSYFQSRIDQELAMARKASHPEATRAHHILASLYAERLALAGSSVGEDIAHRERPIGAASPVSMGWD